MNTNFKLQGKSGCELELLESNGKLVVRKTSKSLEYNHRLEAQYLKQKKYRSFDKFYTPQVIASGINSSGLYYFDMDYISGENFLEYFKKISVEEINLIATDLGKYVTNLVSESTGVIDPRPALNLKLDEVLNKIPKGFKVKHGDTLINIKMVFTTLPLGKLPESHCHGDLTFSNLVFSASSYYLFDFLDSFIESPIIDLVKIRQDTKFYWSLFLSNNKEDFNNSRYRQILHYIDAKLDLQFSSYEWYNTWYKYFEVINLLRIVPYLTTDEENEFVGGCLKKSIGEFEFNCTNSR